MAVETVHRPRPVSEFFNDARPWFEGGVAFVLMWPRSIRLVSVVPGATPARGLTGAGYDSEARP
jgi:hypothetical protein